ncbi:MAG: formylmethanofuran dehydrogenase subunit B [Planctomycetota bacterium]|nr:formylmethanofuran dehydrogenase subunit B [Planctomycetota bacterium]MDA1177305.1 formylmethanofuran dehydrogenase subunit B [Planctomycetota bacterium]
MGSIRENDVACTVCGCVCDDLTVHLDGENIAQVDHACTLAQPWFAALQWSPPPVARVQRQSVPLFDAITSAADILRSSHAPLVFGLSRSSTQGQRAAVRLADVLGGCIDTTASVCHGPSIMAIQQVGESTCSLGEVRNRADLVVFWGADPVVSHPRHLERYSLDPIGQFVPRGRQDRHLVVIDSLPTATSELADTFIQVKSGADFELICALRQTLSQIAIPDSLEIGVDHTAIRSLAHRMANCRYGVVFFGLGLAQQGQGHANVEVLLRLVAELNSHTRFTARRMRIPGDVTGADSVLCWQTGFPFAVNLARGYPRYNPGEYSANELLERGEVDACVLVGSEAVASLSLRAQQTLANLPTIALDYPNCRPTIDATVQLTTAIYGVHEPGTAYRMDEIPIPLRRLIPTHYPTDHDVIRKIIDRL